MQSTGVLELESSMENNVSKLSVEEAKHLTGIPSNVTRPHVRTDRSVPMLGGECRGFLGRFCHLTRGSYCPRQLSSGR